MFLLVNMLKIIDSYSVVLTFLRVIACVCVIANM